MALKQTAAKVAVAFLAVVLSGIPSMGQGAAEREWRAYGRDGGGTRHSPLRQIDRGNVARLARAWTYHTGEISGLPPGREHQAFNRTFESTPIVVGRMLYFSTPRNRVIALDAETGREVWQFDPFAGRRGPPKSFRHRGVSYWEARGPGGRGREGRIFTGTMDGRLIALDARTGRPCPDFGRNGEVDLKADFIDPTHPGEFAITSPPAIYRDLVITGALVPEGQAKGPSGDVRAFDVRTGKLVWRFHTVPRPGEIGNDTWEGDSWRDRTGANVWSIISVDTERGLVLLPVGSASYDFYGGDRKGANLFANSVVALDARTGRYRWHFQTVHHDIWDYDLPAQPVLADLKRGNRTVPAVAIVTKMGFVFVLDRLTGKPLLPVEERPVPRSTVPGEATWPTQPFPVRPPPLARLRITSDDLNRTTPEAERECRELFQRLVNAEIYTPPGLEPTILFPGTLGGATWSGASFDPSLGYLFVNINEHGNIGQMVAQPPGSKLPYRRGGRYGEYARFQDSKGSPCQAPPWGTLNAVDLNRGTIAWRVPLGEIEELRVNGVAPRGTLTLGGSIATAGGLVFIAATTDRRFRAFDAKTGAELWSAVLDADGHATPMTYMGNRTGKQFVVIAAGGAGWFSKTEGDALVAFCLPSNP